MTFSATVFTLMPEIFPGPLGYSLSGNALQRKVWELEVVALRDFGLGKHAQVDDTPAGGGAGMVLRVDVLANAVRATLRDDDPRPRLMFSPRGRPLDQARVRTLAQGAGLVLMCPRFEGVDERFSALCGFEEVSIGDYILSGGEMAAFPLLDSVIRLLPDVMGNADSGHEESFENGLLEYPHYTRPRDFEGLSIPDVLLNGDHRAIAQWRQNEAEALTKRRRPDLWAKFLQEKLSTEA